MSTITQLAFERRYSDDSGVEFGVRYFAHPLGRIELECVNTIDFPIEELDWLIACLTRIRSELAGSPQERREG